MDCVGSYYGSVHIVESYYGLCWKLLWIVLKVIMDCVESYYGSSHVSLAFRQITSFFPATEKLLVWFEDKKITSLESSWFPQSIHKSSIHDQNKLKKKIMSAFCSDPVINNIVWSIICWKPFWILTQFLWIISDECFRRMTSDKSTDSRVDKHPKRKVIDLHQVKPY